MKYTSTATALVVLVGTASAFISSSPGIAASSSSSSSSSSRTSSVIRVSKEFDNEPPALSKMSKSLPFLKRPTTLRGELAGDVGFDPLGFARSKEDLMNYREAEIKHSRLAMLAAAGWPLSEIFDKKIAAVLQLSPAIDAQDRVPSLLNGGLDKISPIYWISCIVGAAIIDLYGVKKSRSAALPNSDYIPGKLDFDPLGLYPKDKDGQDRMQLAEIKHGRLAMIAITGFAFQEAISRSGVVDETPFFFFPLLQTLHEYANSGYTQ
eukprot:scaffold42639_cov37-Attheya_sp.AAC.5